MCLFRRLHARSTTQYVHFSMSTRCAKSNSASHSSPIYFSFSSFQPAAGAVVSANPFAIPPTITGWGPDLLGALASSVGLPPDSKIKVVIRYGDGEEEELKGGRSAWRTLSTTEPTDTIVIDPPPPAAPTICHCEHADCAAAPPGFPTIQKFEQHYIQEHSAAAAAAAAAGGDDETTTAIFKPREDVTTPIWYRKDADSFDHSRIRWEQAAHITKAIVPVSTPTFSQSFSVFRTPSSTVPPPVSHSHTADFSSITTLPCYATWLVHSSPAYTCHTTWHTRIHFQSS